jgi:antitoxin MazE
MTVLQVGKWGNSSGIRLSKGVLDELGIKQGDNVQLTVKDGKAIIEPVKPKKITLEWIISEMKRLGPENAPETVEWAPIPEEAIDDEYSRGEITLDDILKRG